jgi:hypothetical protein
MRDGASRPNAPGARRRVHRGIVLAAALLLACGGRSRTTLKAEEPGPASRAAELDHFPERLALAACAAVHDCCTRGALPYDAEHCRTVMEEQARAIAHVADELGLTYRPEQASRCLEEVAKHLSDCSGLLRGSSCDDCGSFAPKGSCGSAFTRDVAAGEPCILHSDCAPGPSGLSFCGASGRCVRASFGGGRGEPCAGACLGAECFLDGDSPEEEPSLCDAKENLYCDTVAWICREEPDFDTLPGPGDACQPDSRCRPDAWCGAENTCVANTVPHSPLPDCVGRSKQACAADARCVFDPESERCYSQLPCDALPTKTRDEGEALCRGPCSWDSEQRLCLPSHCEARLTEASCVTSSECVWNNGRCGLERCETFVTGDTCPSECSWQPRAWAPGRCDCRDAASCPPICGYELGRCYPVDPPVSLCESRAAFEPDYVACTFGFPQDPRVVHDDCD